MRKYGAKSLNRAPMRRPPSSVFDLRRSSRKVDCRLWIACEDPNRALRRYPQAVKSKSAVSGVRKAEQSAPPGC